MQIIIKAEAERLRSSLTRLFNSSDYIKEVSDVWIIVDRIDQDLIVAAISDQLKNGLSLSLESEQVFGQCRLQHYSVLTNVAVEN